MKFKVGDKVRLIEETICTLGFRVGDICKVTKTDIDEVFYPIQIENDATIGFVTEANIELIKDDNDIPEN